jgi:rhodanese-related sulfurtransferase
MGNSPSIIQKANYEDIQNLNSYSDTILINTLPLHEQKCLIVNTINLNEEESIINNLINNGNLNKKIIIYGKNYTDYSMYKKYEQFKQLGFTNVYIYVGGLFEWLCLQDIYSSDNFITTSRELDILKFKPSSNIQLQLLK